MSQVPNNTRRTGHQFSHRLGNTVRKGRLFFPTPARHKLCSSSILKSMDTAPDRRYSRKVSSPRTILVIWRDTLSIPWLPGKWLSGLIRNPGLWAPYSPCTPILDCQRTYTFGGIHSGRHSTGRFRVYLVLFCTINIRYRTQKVNWRNRIVNTRNTWRKPGSGLPAFRPWLTTGTIHGLQGFVSSRSDSCL